jgi:hypothetical protein
MTTTRQGDQDWATDRDRRDARSDLIGRHVVRALGSPVDLFQVQVRPVGNEHYRVNVLVGKGVTSVRVADSFFLTADDEGNIVTSSPAIVRHY